jgi:hypothetical protein
VGEAVSLRTDVLLEAKYAFWFIVHGPL